MALFGKNKTSEKKHPIIEVIKYDGPNDILIWKFPNEDFNTKTRLIVGPSQEAIFVKGGHVLESLGEGTHTLNTKNFPFIRSLVGLATGGVSPYSCSVYYVNKVVSMGIDWGTDAPISVVDPVYHVPIDVRSYGDFSIQVEDGRKLMEKLVGQTQGFSQREVQQFFSNLMATQVRGVISGTMIANHLSPIGIDAHLAKMSSLATEQIRPVFEPYGIGIRHFTISAVTASELDSIKQKARELQEHRMSTDVDVEDKRKFAQAQAFENRELGINEQQKAVSRAMETLAGNPGPVTGAAGGILYPGIAGGIPVQPSSAGTAEIAQMLLNHQEMAASADNSKQQDSSRESENNQTREPFEKRAEKVKYLFDNGMITQEQFDEKIAQLLSEI